MITNTSKGRTLIDLTGKQFGRWTVVCLAEIRNHVPFWLCRCTCENQRLISGGSLRSGNSKSCGCHRVDVSKTINRTHGKSGTAEHRIWKNIVTRCTNPKSKSFKHYGGRGISICQRWRESFVAFLADMGPRPSSEHSVDRFPDNDGNYEPGNCRWATDEEQRNNKRTNLFLEHAGLRLTITQWSERTGLAISTITNRIRLLKWTIERTLTTPGRKRQ